MKKYLSAPLLLISLSLFAQPSKENIRKLRIQYYQEYQEDKNAGDESNYTAAWWFNRKGDDSIIYRRYDTLLAACTYKNGKLMLRIYTDPASNEKERYAYEYKPDGSYKVTNTESSYGMKSYEWYDKKDKILKSQSPDGNGITYKYDAKGRLVSVISDKKNHGIDLQKKYFYNTKGQLSRLEYKMEENSSEITYEYNTKGQVIKLNEKGKEAGLNFTMTTIMDYNEKGLIITSRSDKKDEEGGWQKTNESFEYKYY
ncbi:MAG TPA: hypothetical protein VLJ68_04335 [Chitinophagaceae bacterium]|nr:hypothetical protein [Chitinophagaceae bacterium]